jgi:DoxX
MATTCAAIRGRVGAYTRLTFLLDRIPYSAVAVVARLSAACVFFRSGFRNLSDWSRTLTLFRETYRMPLIPAHAAACAATSIELICAGLVLLGLFTRKRTHPARPGRGHRKRCLSERLAGSPAVVGAAFHPACARAGAAFARPPHPLAGDDVLSVPESLVGIP